MKCNKTIYIVFLMCFLIGCNGDDSRQNNTSNTNPSTQSPLTSLLDVAYGEHPQQKYDVYLPANPDVTTTKTMLLIHGGGWTSGDKQDMNPFVTLLQQNHPDLAIININYVLAGSGTPAFPNQRADIKNAIAHIKSEAATYRISNHFGILGTSAGAHLGMLHGFNPAHSADIDLIVNIVGPVDFTDPAYLEAETQELKTILQALNGEEEIPEISFLEMFSPVSLIHADAPPVVSFYGNIDPLIPNSQHERLDAKLALSQVQHQLTVYSGGHADWGATSYFDLNQKLKSAVTTFLK